MLLRVPSLEVLTLALRSGAVPERVAAGRVDAVTAGNGVLWLTVAGRKSRDLSLRLAGVGIEIVSSDDVPAGEPRSAPCWAAILPLVRRGVPAAEVADRPVLFELRDAALFPVLATEMLRLGCDRQSVRHIQHDGNDRMLLRAVGPPYYSLLGALDRDASNPADTGLTAYLEQSPGVWVEAGYRHPLGDAIRPAPENLLLIRSPQDWHSIPAAPFRDLNDVVEFTLPAPAESVEERSPPPRFQVPLRLVRSTADDIAEMWVLSASDEEALDAFIAGADDALLARLAFAVVGQNAEQRFLLRSRPSREPTPVLTLDALPLRPYLKIPHLFVPCGHRLLPPLRRETVRTLLANDPQLITWLEPAALATPSPPALGGRGAGVRGVGGAEAAGFRTFQVSDAAFRPLSDWVDYVIDQNRAPLEAWMQSFRFEFEDYVCEEASDDSRPALSAAQHAAPITPPLNASRVPVEPAPETLRPAAPAEPASEPPRESQPATSALAPIPLPSRVEPTAAERRLRELQQRMLPAPFDDEGEHSALWIEMAQIHEALGQPGEASACWLQALWEADPPPQAWLALWQHATRSAATSQGDAALPTLEDVDVAPTSPIAPGEVLRVAAELVVQAERRLPAAEFVARLHDVQRLVEQHEASLPARAAWLAWLALSRLCGGDSLTLARARDRMLERLHRHGLNPQIDLPAFLRTARDPAGERSRQLASRLNRLRELAGTWIARETAAAPQRAALETARTADYADLIFAWGLAKAGDEEECRRLVDVFMPRLAAADAVHHWLAEAFAARIDQLLQAASAHVRLPEGLLSRLERPALREARLGSMPARYFIDRLRRQSRILEPLEEIDAYRRAGAVAPDQFTRAVEQLNEVTERDELRSRVEALLAQAWSADAKPATRIAVLRAALDLGPRLGEDFGKGVLERVVPVVEESSSAIDQAVLLERALFLASHFDQAPLVPVLVRQLAARFDRLLEAERHPANVERLIELLNESFRGLRRLGARDELHGLLRHLTDVLSETRDAPATRKPARPSTSPRTAGDDQAMTLALRLPVAAGWLACGEPERARATLTEAERLVNEQSEAALPKSMHPASRLLLAKTYVAALARLPMDEALPKLESLFRDLRGVHVASQTDSHYSASMLAVVEAVVFALAGDEFAIDPEMRRRLDDSERLVRRRIHRDMRRALP